MKYLRKDQSTIPSLQSGDARADNDLDEANMLNNYFSQCFNTSLPSLSESTATEHLDLVKEAQKICYAQRTMFWVFCNQ